MKTPVRQAVLITAYKNATQILDIVNRLGANFEFYIHVDRKSTMDLDLLSGYPNVHISREFTVHWGSVNHLKCILFLVEQALADNRNAYFHLITGQDFPVKAAGYFLNTLDTRRDYLEYFEMPAAHWLDGGGMRRMEYYQPYEVFDYKTLIGKVMIKLSLAVQKTLRIKRKLPYKVFQKFYGGSTYWSLTRASLQYVLDFTKQHRHALKSMKWASIIGFSSLFDTQFTHRLHSLRRKSTFSPSCSTRRTPAISSTTICDT